MISSHHAHTHTHLALVPPVLGLAIGPQVKRNRATVGVVRVTLGVRRLPIFFTKGLFLGCVGEGRGDSGRAAQAPLQEGQQVRLVGRQSSSRLGVIVRVAATAERRARWSARQGAVAEGAAGLVFDVEGGLVVCEHGCGGGQALVLGSDLTRRQQRLEAAVEMMGGVVCTVCGGLRGTISA